MVIFEVMKKTNIGLVVVVILFAVSIFLAYLTLSKKEVVHNYDYNVDKRDSIKTEIQVVEKEIKTTIIKYKEKEKNEITYINNSSDTVQLLIRSKIRHDIDRSIKK
tara:strand:- start:35 stop:352 length:318 start_codon:yes stop_codon:yes gene_type:complete